MKVASEVPAEKLRGGFYTPDPLVQLCFKQVSELLPGIRQRLLEPSVGDGAFLRNLPRSPLASKVSSITAIEPMEIEAERARRALVMSGWKGEVLTTSAIDWAATTTETYDVAVGNPPFVRYQFVSAADRTSTLDLARRLRLHIGGVANLWIPVLLGALSRLRPGGAFAFVVPTECMTGCSASVVRRWLIGNCDEVRFDLFPPGSFPAVLQEVAVLSGRLRDGCLTRQRLRLHIAEHMGLQPGADWSHEVAGDGPWTKYLLSPSKVRALETATADERVATLGSLVAFEVSIVTGANGFFTVSEDTVDKFELHAWTRPLLPRIRHAAGLRYTLEDHALTEGSGARGWLLDFSLPPDPATHERAAAYIQTGESQNLHTRYKCRIREPWFVVPGITSGELLLSKRSHLHPRVVLNEAGVFTTDTIYRGRMLDLSMSATALAANFHSSLTLLSAELEGRSFGGGVLELVPSEIGRLLILAAPVDAQLAAHLDALARAGDSDALIGATDAHLVDSGVIEAEVMKELDQARRMLLARRLDRNRKFVQPRDAEERPAAA
ncbi:MAG: SAM-dependent methyltransferase [Solirubrobacteraceae bacterium]